MGLKQHYFSFSILLRQLVHITMGFVALIRARSRPLAISFVPRFHQSIAHGGSVVVDSTASKPANAAPAPSVDKTVEPVVDDEMEQEEMFVDAHDDFEIKGREWGGPRRGGRFPEPTRFGDWERKGRCTDF